MKKINSLELKNIIILVLSIFALFTIMHSICGSSIFGKSGWNSYELQAKAWLNGKTYLENGKDLSNLELAIYKDKYFVSFPPFPSVVMLPFVIIFGDNVPNNFIILLFAIITSIIAYKILRRQGTRRITSIFLSFAYVFASNMTTMVMNGGVWFVAQALNLLLCTMAVDFLLKDKRIPMYTCLALAVGCRPFSAIYIVAAFIFCSIKDRNNNAKQFIKDNLIPIIPVLIIAIIYCVYNYVRFDNPLEFGHNYLPEFMEAQNGQFNIKYLTENLKQLFFNPMFTDWDIEKINMPFCFLIANPFFIVCLYKAIKDIIKNHKISITRLLFFIGIVLNIVFLCIHKTLGGWQFGARYTCDFLAIAFLCMVISIKKQSKKDRDNVSIDDKTEDENLLPNETLAPVTLNIFEYACLIFGIILNIYGITVLWLA